MPSPPLSKELAKEAVDAVDAAGGNESAAALSLNIARGTLQNRLRAAVASVALK